MIKPYSAYKLLDALSRKSLHLGIKTGAAHKHQACKVVGRELLVRNILVYNFKGLFKPLFVYSIDSKLGWLYYFAVLYLAIIMRCVRSMLCIFVFTIISENGFGI